MSASQLKVRSVLDGRLYYSYQPYYPHYPYHPYPATFTVYTTPYLCYPSPLLSLTQGGAARARCADGRLLREGRSAGASSHTLPVSGLRSIAVQ